MQTFKKEFIEAARLFVDKKYRHEVLIQFEGNDIFIVAGNWHRFIVMKDYKDGYEYYANYVADIRTLLACREFEIATEGVLWIGEKAHISEKRSLLRHWREALHNEFNSTHNKEIYDQKFLLTFEKAAKIIHAGKTNRYIRVKKGIVDLGHEKAVGVIACVKAFKETFKIDDWV